MGSRFLDGSSADLASLQDGTFQMNISSATIQTLSPNLPVKTNGSKQLTSGLIQLSDCNFVPLANPFPGTVSAQNFITAYDTTPVNVNSFIATTVSAISGLESDTQFISASPSPNTTTINSIADIPTIYTAEIADQASQSQLIQLSNSDINVASSSFTYNGDEVATNGDLGNYLPLSGGIMTGNLDMGNNAVSDVNELFMNNNGDIVTPGTNQAGLVYSGGAMKYMDDTSTLYTLATTNSLGSYLPLSGGTMTGAINMGSQSIDSVSSISTSSAQVNIGSSNTIAGSSSVIVGASNAIGGVSGGSSMIYGNNNNASGSVNGQSIIYGNANSDSNASGGSFIFGFSNTNGTGSRNVLIGRNLTVPDGVNEAFSIGFNLTNSTSNSLLIGGTNHANIRAGGTVCDLGTTANPFRTLYLNTNIAGPTNSRSADDILSCATAGVSGNILTFTGTAKVAQDSGTALSNLLAKSGGTMTGSIDMGGFEVKNCSAFRISSLNQKTIVGSSTTSAGSDYSTIVGGVATIDGSSISTTSIGYGNQTTVSTAGILLGTACNCATSSNSILIGSTCTATGAIGSHVIGTQSGSTANAAHCFGSYLANATAGSLLLDTTANIRTNNTTCDLGTAANPFQTLYLNSNIAGPINSRSVDNIISCATNGVSGNISTFTGTAKVVQDSGVALATLSTTPYAGWSSSATYNPSFTAGVVRLVPPTTSAAGALSEFAYSAGVLTYTGTAARNVLVCFNISFISGASGSNMTFFISVNGSLTATPYRKFIQVGTANATFGLETSLQQVIPVTTGTTIQLAASCATLSAAVAFTFVSCAVRGGSN